MGSAAPDGKDARAQAQKAEFAARLERIQKGGENTNRTVFVGSDERMPLTKEGLEAAQKRVAKAHKAETKAAAKAEAKAGAMPMGSLLALMVGVLAFVPALLATTRMTVEVEGVTKPDLTLGIALALALTVALLIGLRAPVKLALACLGAFAMASGHHNLVHMAPDLVAALLPPDWVAATLSQTEPGTLVFGAHRLTL